MQLYNCKATKLLCVIWDTQAQFLTQEIIVITGVMLSKSLRTMEFMVDRIGLTTHDRPKYFPTKHLFRSHPRKVFTTDSHRFTWRRFPLTTCTFYYSATRILADSTSCGANVLFCFLNILPMVIQSKYSKRQGNNLPSFSHQPYFKIDYIVLNVFNAPN